MLPVAALVLADARLPTGAYAHSAGVEHAVSVGRVHDLESLRAFAVGRLWTAGLSDAALTAATVAAARGSPRSASPAGPLPAGPLPAAPAAKPLPTPAAWPPAAGPQPAAPAVGPPPPAVAGPAVPWAELDAEAAARLAPPALRAVSRRLGRQLLRAAERVWPSPLLTAARAALPDGPHQPIALGAVAAAAGLEPADAALCSAYHTVTTVSSAGLRLLGLDPYACAAAVAALAGPMQAVAAEAAAAARGPLADLPCASPLAADLAAEVHARWEVRLFAS